MSSKIVNIRLETKIIEDLDEISKSENADRSTIIRRLLRQAINKTKIENALKHYKEGEMSIEMASEAAGIDI